MLLRNKKNGSVITVPCVPNTKKEKGIGIFGFFGMSEIPCNEIPKQSVENQNNE